MAKQKVKLTYIGRRLSGSKVVKAFLYGKKEIYFKATRGVYIGNVYEAERTAKGDFTMARRPAYVGDAEATKPEQERWEAEEAIVQDFLDLRRQESKIKKKARALDRFADELYPVIKDFGMGDRNAIVRQIVNRCMKKGPVSL